MAGDGGWRPALQNLKSAATTTTSRRSACFRPAIAAGFIRFALDADHGEDDNSPHVRARRDIPRRAYPPNGRKFDDGPHIRSLNCRALKCAPATWRSLRSVHG